MMAPPDGNIFERIEKEFNGVDETEVRGRAATVEAGLRDDEWRWRASANVSPEGDLPAVPLPGDAITHHRWSFEILLYLVLLVFGVSTIIWWDSFGPTLLLGTISSLVAIVIQRAVSPPGTRTKA